MSVPGFWDFDLRCEELKAMRNDLGRLAEAVDFEIFRPLLKNTQERKAETGRPPYDAVFLFKILVLQSLYNLSDEQTEYQIRDRISFMHFLGLGLSDRVPDQKTIWLFRDQLRRADLAQPLFARFEAELKEKGYSAKQGSIMDASIVDVPRQHNTRKENEQIARGETPPSFDANPAKRAQKDMDARWVTKNKARHFGYKNHLSVDVQHKLIRKWNVTDAATHDSQIVKPLLQHENSSRDVYGDSAYRSAKINGTLAELGFRERIHRKGYRNHPLSKRSKEANRKKSKIRARVEHIFGRMERLTNGTWLRVVGIARATIKIGLRNLVYNLDRYAYLVTA